MKFEVETGQVQNLTQNFQDALSQISGNKQRMYQALEGLDGMWQGQAHDAFVAQYQKDNQEMETLIQELQQVAENIGTARQEYDNCEQEVKDMISAINV